MPLPCEVQVKLSYCYYFLVCDIDDKQPALPLAFLSILVKSLTEVVPQLIDKLRTVEQKWPANNVSASIQRIRELIAQTRSVANKVKIPEIQVFHFLVISSLIA